MNMLCYINKCIYIWEILGKTAPTNQLHISLGRGHHHARTNYSQGIELSNASVQCKHEHENTHACTQRKIKCEKL